MPDNERTMFVVEYQGDRFQFESFFAAARHAVDLEKRGLVPLRVCVERGVSRSYFKDGAATASYYAARRHAR